MPTAAYSSRQITRSPVLVALSGWLLPGTGYVLLGQRTRGLTIGVTILVLFILGLLIGGIRVLEAPGWGSHGERLSDRQPMDEIRAKPWAIAQVLAGPVAVASGSAAVIASRHPDAQAISDGSIEAPSSPQALYPAAARSHARVNEIGVLYTAIAGMLNLLAIIDSASRAADGDRQPDPERT